jgi:hypothetical protein
MKTLTTPIKYLIALSLFFITAFALAIPYCDTADGWVLASADIIGFGIALMFRPICLSGAVFIGYALKQRKALPVAYLMWLLFPTLLFYAYALHIGHKMASTTY